ncbi:sigma-54-dependent Fis family transcriptional regulator [Spirochaetia bacterium]|nr:sigma-54-dependent Fis family transcriptional regulator [Spirochaetia bacterium]
MRKVLIIDDEQSIRAAMAPIMEDEGYKALVAPDAIAGIDIISKEHIDLIFLDVMLPKMGGIDALGKIKKGHPEIEVIVISGHANIDTAVKAVKLGAFDYLEKPLSIDKILTVCRNAFALIDLRNENKELKKTSGGKDEILGECKLIEQLRSLIKQAASSDARILITGENGSGKELVARAVHRLSKRAKAAFIEVNCAAIPDTLIESELFGHEKGAFTDAYSIRRGRFELASGGTLFMDEIGDMSLSAQAKVLRAIQEQTIERVGGEKSINIDVRIIAATNKNLEEACKNGQFRQDLYFRLNVIPVYVPALRERAGDIMVLLDYFLKEAGGYSYSFDKEAENFLKGYRWPGNVRELKNLAERITILCDEGKISIDKITELLNTGSQTRDGTSQRILNDSILDETYTTAKEMFEKFYLEYQLEKNDGSIARTAEVIGMYPGNLHTKLKKFGVERKGQ